MNGLSDICSGHMIYDPKKHHRRSTRLRNFDYSQAGAYFVTVVTAGRKCLLGEIASHEMRPNAFGRLVQSVWYDLPKHYPRVGCDAFVIMPNHVHGVLILTDVVSVGAGNGRTGFKPAPTGHRLPEIVRAFKTFSARRINEIRDTRGVSVWQRNYFEHVVRNEAELFRIREYVLNNPLQWELDIENPMQSAKGRRKSMQSWEV
jgi:putative transposase